MREAAEVLCGATYAYGPSSTLRMLDDALKLVQKARHHAGHTHDDTPLSTTEFKKALDFLQRDFEENFVENKKLQARIRIH